MKAASKRDWVLLIHLLPPKPTSLRVSVWRKLQKLGAVSLKNSVYLLPFDEKTHEDFQWLKQEIESQGGEATVFRAGSVEGTTDEEIIASFRRARDEDYARVTAELKGLAGAVREQGRGGHLSAGRLRAHEAELDKLHAELEGIIATDFFDASGRQQAVAAYEQGLRSLRESQGGGAQGAKAVKAGKATLDKAEYQGRKWVTRRNLHIDRLASAWLIRQFIDKRPRFYFVAEGETVKGGIPFDMFGAEFTHHGEDCTFETLIKRFGLDDDRALRGVAEIVHDIDLKDDKFNRLEAAGLDSIVQGLSKLLSDREMVRQASVIFDGLYALLSEGAGKSRKGQGGGRAKKRTARGGG